MCNRRHDCRIAARIITFVLLIAAVAAVGASPASASPAAPIIADGGFEAGAPPWQVVGAARVALAPHGGRARSSALEIISTGTSDAGAYTRLAAPTPPGRRFRVSAWVRATGSAVGKWFRLQLNETGGAAAATVLAGHSQDRRRLTGEWQQFVVTGRVRSAGRDNVTAIVVAEKARADATFYVDDVAASTLHSRLGAPLVRFSRRIAPPGTSITVATPGGRVFHRAFGKRPTTAELFLAPATVSTQIMSASDSRLIHVANIAMNASGYGVARFVVPTAPVGLYTTLLHCGSCTAGRDGSGLLDAGPYPTGFQITPPAPTPTARKALLFGGFALVLVAGLGAIFARRRLRQALPAVGGTVSALPTALRRRSRTWSTPTAIGWVRRSPRALDMVALVIALVVTLVALTAVLRLHSLPGIPCAPNCASLNAPFAYAGLDASDDSELFHMVVKEIHDNGWYLRTPQLGAPAGQQLYDYPLENDNLQFGIIKLFDEFSGNSALVTNLYYLLTYFLTVITAFIVLRLFGLSRLASSVFAILFSFAPYHFLRGETHLVLSGYYAVPLSVYLILTVLRGRPLFTRNARDLPGLVAFASRRTLGTLVISVVIASTGLYYTVFTVALLLVASLFSLISRSSRWAAGAGLVACALICLVAGLNLLPSFVYHLHHGSNIASTQRTPQDTEWYSLRIINLLLPAPGHRVALLNKIQTHYTQNVADPRTQGEASYEPLGLIGALGFLWLLAVAAVTLVSVRPRWRIRGLHRYAAFTVLAAILIGTTGGFATLLAYYVNADIRGWNRLSIFIEFLALLAVALLLDQGLRRRARAHRFRWLAPAALVAVLVLGIFDQTSPVDVPNYPYLTGLWQADAAYVKKIEDRLPRGAAVFQLPYVPFVGGGIGNILSYDPLRGYLHSRDLRWSFGAERGRPDQDWQPYLSEEPLPTLLDAVVAAGFDGIWLDRNGYADSGRVVERSLRSLVREKPLVGTENRFAFYDLRPFAARLHRRYAPAKMRALRRAVLEPLRLLPAQGYPPQIDVRTALSPADGFDQLEQITVPDHSRALVIGPRAITWRWTTAPTATLTFVNPSAQSRAALFRAILQTGSAKPKVVSLALPDGSVQTLRVSSSGLAVSRTLVLPPGRSTATITYNGPIVEEPAIARRVYVRLAADLNDPVLAQFGGLPQLDGCKQPVPINGCAPQPFSAFSKPQRS